MQPGAGFPPSFCVLWLWGLWYGRLPPAVCRPLSVLGLGGGRERKEKAASYDSEEERSSGGQSFREFYDPFLAFVVQLEVNGFL